MEFLRLLVLPELVWEIVEILALVVFLSKSITVWLPNKSSNKFIQAILDFLNKLSLNIGEDANQTIDYLAKYQEFRRRTLSELVGKGDRETYERLVHPETDSLRGLGGSESVGKTGH